MLKRIAIVIALSLPIGGCALFDAVGNFSSAITSVTEPASINTQYQAEAAVYVERRLVAGYFRLRQCRASETASILNPCARRSIKVVLQDANRRMTTALNKFRLNPSGLTAIRSAAEEYKNTVASYRSTIAITGVQ